MTRGNQRDRDRERAAARKQAAAKGKEDGLTPEQRRERDKKALEEKAAKRQHRLRQEEPRKTIKAIKEMLPVKNNIYKQDSVSCKM